MNKKHYVYWYHLAEHSDMLTQGYIGVTVDLCTRHSAHTVHVKNSASRLRNAFNKYGEDRIMRTIITTCTKEDAYRLEEQLRPLPNIGWNITTGGGAPPDCTGRINSEETKKKMSRNSAKNRLGVSSPYKGMHDRYSAETRALIGSYHKGKTISDAHRKSCAEKLSGSNNVQAKKVYLVHAQDMANVLTFGSISDAAKELGLNYSRLRSLYQDTHRKQRPMGKEWICLCEQHVADPIQAIIDGKTETSLLRKQTVHPSGADNHRSQEIVLENKEGKICTFTSILQAAKTIGLNEATLRYHVAQTKKRKKDTKYTSVGWRVKYVEVQG